MKLADHVDQIRQTIYKAFDKSLARLGVAANKRLEIEKLPAELHSKRQRIDELVENHTGETGSYAQAREKALDELTFTLFNRIAAIKVMEANELFPPVITKEVEHGDRSFGHKAWLEDRPDMRAEELEGIREYIKHAFNSLGEEIALFHKDYPYAYLPDAVSLNEIIDAFNAVEKDAQVEENIWQSDDILGWLYESYNNAKKAEFKASEAKTEYDKVSLQSQVYTPRWVVQFLVENSLGKLYLEMYPDSEIRKHYKIANAPNQPSRKIKPLHEIKLIDPASGSGNFLLYAFDFFYALYQDQIDNYGADYELKDVPKLIIENNIFGVDLDDRAIQLAQLGLYIKAKKKRRSTGNFQFNIVSSDFYLPPYQEIKSIFEEDNKLSAQQKQLIADIWSDLRQAYKFGSLVRIEEKLRSEVQGLYDQLNVSGQGNLLAELQIADYQAFENTFFANLRSTVEKYATHHGKTFLNSKTQDAILFLKILNNKYDVATANPPYTDSADFGEELKDFLDTNYKKPQKFNSNLYAAFIKRCYEFILTDGYISMVHPSTFMYIKTFEDVRKFIIENTNINLFVEWGYLGMFNPSVRVDSALYTLKKHKSTDLKLGNSQFHTDHESTFIKLNTLYEMKRYTALFDAYDKLISKQEHEFIYHLNQNKIKAIKTWPFIYWISDEFRDKFKKTTFEDVVDVVQGIATSNNIRFLRFWWEVNTAHISQEIGDKRKWVKFVKGGPYKKWSGNIWLCINWAEDGKEVKAFCEELNKTKPGGRIKNQKYYFREGISYSALGGTGMSFRYLPVNCIFDVGGSCIFGKNDNFSLNYFLCLSNSKLATHSLSCLNPTVNTQVFDINRLPYSIPSKNTVNIFETLATINIKISEHLLKFKLVENSYQYSPFTWFNKISDFKSSFQSYCNYENHLLTQVLLNEAIINEKIFEVYELTEHDKSMVLAKEGESIGSLPVLAEARDAYLDETEATKSFSLNVVRDFILSLPTREFTMEEHRTLESGFSTLYQSNNELEVFCIRHQVNPINVWYWFKQSNIVPTQRMNDIAMEFLANLLREILMEDEDGIIPLIPNAGDKILYERIQDKFQEKGYSTAHFSSFDIVIGKELNIYLKNDFFQALSDHLNLFLHLPKTPFIWHITSGPDHGFDAYIIIYKWSRDKLFRLKSVYVEQRERALINRQTDLANDQSASAQNESDLITRQLREIESFKQKIDELLEEGYNPILDDGVGKNIAPLQKKKMLAYEVLNDGQLKKYLNADW